MQSGKVECPPGRQLLVQTDVGGAEVGAEAVAYLFVEGVAGFGLVCDFLCQPAEDFPVGVGGVRYWETGHRLRLHFIIAVRFGRKNTPTVILADAGVQETQQIKASFHIMQREYIRCVTRI